jgi:hypothetical protein
MPNETGHALKTRMNTDCETANCQLKRLLDNIWPVTKIET